MTVSPIRRVSLAPIARGNASFPASDPGKFQRDTEERKIQAALNAEPARCMVGNSPAIRHVFNLIRKFGASDAPVLITGETGTGKELIAAAIHAKSPRASGPFKVVNCAAIPPTLIASELFGHEKGAFTGALNRKKGIIQAAEGGTLFLDEIGHLPLDLQGYLLRVLQEKTIQMVGGVSQIPIDTRIISATNVDFPHLISAGQFRSDLFFRLKVLSINSPPLRDRGDDVLALALFYLRKFAAENGRDDLNFTTAAERKLMSHRWPGNIRELMACIQRAVVVSDGNIIDADDLDLIDFDLTPPGNQACNSPDITSLPRPRERVAPENERTRVLDAIMHCDGNLTQAAAVLRISRMTMYRLLRRHAIDLELTSIRSDSRIEGLTRC